MKLDFVGWRLMPFSQNLGVYSDASVKGWTSDCVNTMVNGYLYDLMRRQSNIQGLALQRTCIAPRAIAPRASEITEG